MRCVFQCFSKSTIKSDDSSLDSTSSSVDFLKYTPIPPEPCPNWWVDGHWRKYNHNLHLEMSGEGQPVTTFHLYTLPRMYIKFPRFACPYFVGCQIRVHSRINSLLRWADPSAVISIG